MWKQHETRRLLTDLEALCEVGAVGGGAAVPGVRREPDLDTTRRQQMAIQSIKTRSSADEEKNTVKGLRRETSQGGAASSDPDTSAFVAEGK